MIDFRYHMVSLAAVLIALSMGIVLGAGPLNDDIGNTLTSEVTRLRQEKDDMRRQVAEQERAATARETFEESILPEVVAGQLDGRSVAVVRLPQAEDGAVAGIEDTLDDADATRIPTISINAAWAADGDSADESRAEAASRSLEALGRRDDGDTPLADVLGVVVGGRTSSGAPAPSADQRTAAFESLSDSGLVSGGAPTESADLVVVVGGPVAGDPQDRPEQPDPAASAVAETWLELVRGLDQRSDGVVLAAAWAEDGTGDISPVTLARSDSGLAEGVSTVDVPELSIGRADVVLALVEQAAGDFGHYGLGPDASAAIPERS